MNNIKLSERDTVITEQVIEIRNLKSVLNKLLKALNEIDRSIVCCGGPLNDNIHKYNNDQLKIFYEFGEIIKNSPLEYTEDGEIKYYESPEDDGFKFVNLFILAENSIVCRDFLADHEFEFMGLHPRYLYDAEQIQGFYLPNTVLIYCIGDYKRNPNYKSFLEIIESNPWCIKMLVHMGYTNLEAAECPPTP